ncbi:OBAP family protein [Aspergillus undulatus]|uniref:OBAP family protein n=1 Tax=Aspergillus undulatus TaxID=1810928 RepID=UPI003CCCCCBB
MAHKSCQDIPGDPLSTKSQVLETAASATQDFTPPSQICAHLHAYHVYADDPTRCVEANHYCSHITEDLRQCLIYDSPHKNARLIGIEYMVTPRVFETLPTEERKLWHSHQYEVKSGMLIMPTPRGIPNGVWEAAETSEMRDVLPLYGKTYHLWQVDRGDKVPMGEPKLMLSFTDDEKVRRAVSGGLGELVKGRDEAFGVDTASKAEKRMDIFEVEKHPDADSLWDIHEKK